ncbi:hypothetical protein C8J57DRAFT_1533727 [Mycena rebaudengoi]|nr:hypothetical protein C8J57DRAFT_1533727 [Mycena rebaudengoi]
MALQRAAPYTRGRLRALQRDAINAPPLPTPRAASSTPATRLAKHPKSCPYFFLPAARGLTNTRYYFFFLPLRGAGPPTGICVFFKSTYTFKSWPKILTPVLKSAKSTRFKPQESNSLTAVRRSAREVVGVTFLDVAAHARVELLGPLTHNKSPTTTPSAQGGHTHQNGQVLCLQGHQPEATIDPQTSHNLYLCFDLSTPTIFTAVKHGKPVDVWAMGVVTYFLLAGYTPFDRDTPQLEMEAITAGDYKFEPAEYWANRRPTVQEALAHKARFCLPFLIPLRCALLTHARTHADDTPQWLASTTPHFVPDPEGEPRDLLPHVKKAFNAKLTWRKAAFSIKALNRMTAMGGYLSTDAQALSEDVKRFKEESAAERMEDASIAHQQRQRRERVLRHAGRLRGRDGQAREGVVGGVRGLPCPLGVLLVPSVDRRGVVSVSIVHDDPQMICGPSADHLQMGLIASES